MGVQQTRRDEVAIFTVRLWREAGSPTGVRARITYTLDVERGDETTQVASAAEDVMTIIRKWLDDFATAGVV